MSDDPIETGLVAAAVTIKDFAPTDPVPHPDDPRRFDHLPLPVAVEAVMLPTKVQMPDGWDLPKVAGLVTDVAQNMYDMPYLLKKHGLTNDQYGFLKENEFFKRALEAETLTWQGTNSIQKRLALESAIAVEAALPTVAARLKKNTEPLADVVALLKVLAELAGAIGAKAAAPGGTGERFKIVINMGSDTLERTATGNMEVQSQSETSGVAKTLSALAEGQGNKSAI